MIRRERSPSTPPTKAIGTVRDRLRGRRRFLIQAAGGSLALLFAPLPTPAQSSADPWTTLDAVLRHLLPTEPDSPGAADINALAYLRFVTDDPKVDAGERAFIVQGARWIDELSVSRYASPFADLDETGRERLLRDTARSAAGENWIATLLTYLFEALLTAPAYGGNPQGIGWRWLEYVPGFPLPGPGTRYPELPL